MFDNLDEKAFAEALANDSKAVLLDVRTPAEFAEGHLAGAINMDVMQPDFGLQIESLDPDASYFVYCRSGARSANACLQLAEQGIGNRRVNLLGGVLAWRGELVL